MKATEQQRGTAVVWCRCPFVPSVLVIVCSLLGGCRSSQPVTIRVLSYNIHHGEGMDGRHALERIAEVIRSAGADLVSLQEVDRGAKRTNGVDQSARLAALTGMQAVFGKNIDCQGGGYGNAVLSRFPVEHHDNHHLPRLASNEQRGLLEVHVRVGEQRLVFFATHLDHQHDDAERLACVAALNTIVERLGQIPMIVAGDLNDLPDSAVLDRAKGFLCDASESAAASQPTFPADRPARRIDYILWNRHRALRCVDCRVIPEAVASDHRPVLAVFTLEVEPSADGAR